MAGGTAAAIARNNPIVRPTNGLLVNQFYRGQRLRLLTVSSWPEHASIASHAWRLKSVCSNRGPVIAWERGLCDRDQTVARLGDWVISLGAVFSLSSVVSGLVLAGTAASNRRIEVLNARFEVRKLRASARDALN